jgi:hypothetical protein
MIVSKREREGESGKGEIRKKHIRGKEKMEEKNR